MSSRRDLPPDLLGLAGQQARCLSRQQLRDGGLGADAVARHVRPGTWQLLGPLVVVTHSGPVGDAERRWAAALWTAPAGVLAGLTALAVHGLRGWERDVVDVCVPRHATRVTAPWVSCRTSTRWTGTERTSRAGLPVHTVERATLDAAADATTSRVAGGLVAAVVQQRLTTAERLRVCAASASRSRHRREVLAVLADVGAGSHAMTEVDLVRLCRRNRLPVPTRQSRREDATGRVRHLDAEWTLEDGRRVLLEVDGALHLEEGRWYDDLLRAAEVLRHDEVLLRLPARALRAEPERVVALLRRHLQRPQGDAVDRERG